MALGKLHIGAVVVSREIIMLLDLPEVILFLDESTKEFASTDIDKLYPFYLDRFRSVTESKFFSGDYFNPYFNDQGGFSPAVHVKKRYDSVDDARWLGKYCAGFIDGRHVITVYPGQRTVNVLQATLCDEVGSVYACVPLHPSGSGSQKKCILRYVELVSLFKEPTILDLT